MIVHLLPTDLSSGGIKLCSLRREAKAITFNILVPQQQGYRTDFLGGGKRTQDA